MADFTKKYFGYVPGKRPIFRTYFTRNGKTYYAKIMAIRLGCYGFNV